MFSLSHTVHNVGGTGEGEFCGIISAPGGKWEGAGREWWDEGDKGNPCPLISHQPQFWRMVWDMGVIVDTVVCGWGDVEGSGGNERDNGGKGEKVDSVTLIPKPSIIFWGWM